MSIQVTQRICNDTKVCNEKDSVVPELIDLEIAETLSLEDFKIKYDRNYMTDMSLERGWWSPEVIFNHMILWLKTVAFLFSVIRWYEITAAYI